MTDKLIHGLYREKIASVSKAPHDVLISERWARCQFEAAREPGELAVSCASLSSAFQPSRVALLPPRSREMWPASTASSPGLRPPRTIAAQGGINAAKNYRNDNDLFTVSSTTRSRADYRARE